MIPVQLGSLIGGLSSVSILMARQGSLLVMSTSPYGRAQIWLLV